MSEMTPEQAQTKVAELVKQIRVAMVTSCDADGKLVSRPMATQDVEFDGDVWFVAERASHKVADIEVRPQVNVSYSSSSSWVSLSGHAEVVNDEAKLAQLWNMFTDAWLPGGPDNPNNVLIRVRADSAEYWDSPGSKVVQLANLVKMRVTGQRYEADNERVDL